MHKYIHTLRPNRLKKTLRLVYWLIIIISSLSSLVRKIALSLGLAWPTQQETLCQQTSKGETNKKMKKGKGNYLKREKYVAGNKNEQVEPSKSFNIRNVVTEYGTFHQASQSPLALKFATQHLSLPFKRAITILCYSILVTSNLLLDITGDFS